jgi:hypothetical protein
MAPRAMNDNRPRVAVEKTLVPVDAKVTGGGAQEPPGLRVLAGPPFTREDRMLTHGQREWLWTTGLYGII